MEKVEVPAEPGRLISAIARIGYDPEVALCDLIDNSLDAGAGQVYLSLIPEYHAEEGETDTIARYVICDDGQGMDRETLIRAFTLGASRSYPNGSLGKFGIGLKSAGLSLGNQIAVLTKKNSMSEPICAVLSIDEIESTGEYKISIGEVPPEYEEFWLRKFPSGRNSGSTLIIESLNENQPPYTRFVNYLKRYCAVVYHMFMSDESKPLILAVNDNVGLSPIDPLFLRDGEANGSLLDPDDWDGRTVRLLLKDSPLPLTATVSATVAMTHLVHPPTFQQEGRQAEVRDKYLIDADPYTQRPRHGFYIYRNRRIIVLAERFHGLVSSQTQAWAFRGRLMFDESADKILSLDVKKRHCQLPREARNNLLALVRTHQQKSIKAWEEAGKRTQEKRRESKEQHANESIAATPVASLDYAPGTDLSNSASVESRKKLLEEVKADSLKNITDPDVTPVLLEEKAEDKSIVIPVKGLKGNAMWLPYPSIEQGAAETLINKHHSWVTEAYAVAEEDPKITMILHQLFTILSRAELEVRSTPWTDLPQGATDKVLERFRRKVSTIGEDLADSLAAELAKFDGNSAA